MSESSSSSGKGAPMKKKENAAEISSATPSQSTMVLLERIRTRAEAKQASPIDYVKIDEVVQNRFRIMCKIYIGGFGQIYKAMDEKLEKEVVVKFEPVEENMPNMEAIVLSKFSASRYCPKIYGKGRTKLYNFVAMQLLGKNLTDLRRECTLQPPRFSCSTNLRITKQCINSVESLHSIGFLHRDIKPSNFAVGVSVENLNQIYLIDFGLAKYYKRKDGSVRPPRRNAGFRGTVRYASLNAHDNIDLSRRDDLWSMFYSYFEMLIGELPWKLTNDRQVVAHAKRLHTPESLSQWIPRETGDFVRCTRQLQFESKPDYDSITKCFEDSITRLKIGENDRFDWEVENCQEFHHWTVADDCVIGGKN